MPAALAHLPRPVDDRSPGIHSTDTRSSCLPRIIPYPLTTRRRVEIAEAPLPHTVRFHGRRAWHRGDISARCLSVTQIGSQLADIGKFFFLVYSPCESDFSRIPVVLRVCHRVLIQCTRVVRGYRTTRLKYSGFLLSQLP